MISSTTRGQVLSHQGSLLEGALFIARLDITIIRLLVLARSITEPPMLLVAFHLFVEAMIYLAKQFLCSMYEK
jgi:hypothetical protein